MSFLENAEVSILTNKAEEQKVPERYDDELCILRSILNVISDD